VNNRTSDYDKHIPGYEDKHLVDLTDPQEPDYEAWYTALDADKAFQEAVMQTLPEVPERTEVAAERITIGQKLVF